jgi:hypothetical protein
VLDDEQKRARSSIDAYHVGLRLMGVADRRDITQEDRCLVQEPDGRWLNSATLVGLILRSMLYS